MDALGGQMNLLTKEQRHIQGSVGKKLHSLFGGKVNVVVSDSKEIMTPGAVVADGTCGILASVGLPGVAVQITAQRAAAVQIGSQGVQIKLVGHVAVIADAVVDGVVYAVALVLGALHADGVLLLALEKVGKGQRAVLVCGALINGGREGIVICAGVLYLADTDRVGLTGDKTSVLTLRMHRDGAFLICGDDRRDNAKIPRKLFHDAASFHE
jgi:hypothetical protein